MVQKRIFELIDDNKLRKVIRNHSRRRIFYKNVLSYDEIEDEEFNDEYEESNEFEDFEDVIEKSKSTKSRKPRKSNNYQNFVKKMLPKVKKEYPLTTPQERMKIVAEMWKEEKV